jgi:phenylpropionate dioxygenase-like ring-hydroxylating dioxygenase large terminal subunit
MVIRTQAMQGPYGGYYQSEEPAEDAELTHVGPGTPCGEYLRRFWQPVAFSHELKDLPVRLRILGEDLVLFRDLSGRVGLLKLHCLHRGTSLEYGRIAERGLRCCYHAWLYDVDGTVLETPGEPPESTFKNRLWLGAYPTHEYKGLVFAYMGPPDQKPVFPIYDSFELLETRPVPGRKHVLPCNWVQIIENNMDSVHLVFLHSKLSGPQFNDSHGLLPQLKWQETPIGVMSTQTRRVGPNVWSRNSEIIWPNLNQFQPTWQDGKTPQVLQRPMHTIWGVPIDDTHTMNISFMHYDDSEDRDWERVRESFGQTGDRPYEERQRVPGDYDALTGQRPIAIHALEHLGSTDRGVILFRRLLREGIRAVQRGEDPKGLLREPRPPIPTYCHDAVIAAPPGATPQEERQLLLDIETKVAARTYLEAQATAR